MCCCLNLKNIVSTSRSAWSYEVLQHSPYTLDLFPCDFNVLGQKKFVGNGHLYLIGILLPFFASNCVLVQIFPAYSVLFHTRQLLALLNHLKLGVLYARILRWPNKKKSKLLRSSDLLGHCCGPPRLIQRLEYTCKRLRNNYTEMSRTFIMHVPHLIP